MAHVAALIAVLPLVAAQSKVVANIQAAEYSGLTISGSVTFEQGADPLGDVTATVSLTGLTPGAHGFHVHQFGDVRETTGLQTMSAHFVPMCSFAVADSPCKSDQTHGLPPSTDRQPGDMGNIIAANGTGAVETTIVLGQQKMSLKDGLRSIVGRAVLVHSREDDGTQPYGNAGPPEAYGVIGIASTADGATNEATAPSIPEVDKVICTFEASDTSTITGSALLTLLVPDRPGVVHLTARLQGLQPNAEHSFHFHTWGDMTVDMNGGQLGSIYSENGIVVEELTVNEQGIGLIDQEFESETLLQHVGRALTLHEGPDKSTPTVAAAVCGLAHPRAILDTTGAVQITMSGTVFGRGTLYYMICAAVLGGGCIVLGYLHNKGKINLPIGSKTHKPLPPPPPPDGKATSKTKEVEVEVNKV